MHSVDNIFVVDTINVGCVDCFTADNPSVVNLSTSKTSDRPSCNTTQRITETMYLVFVFVF